MTTQTQAQHTPGPWYDATTQRDQSEREIWHDEAGLVATVSYVGRYQAAQTCETLTANGRLIAAAPELLEALTKLLTVADGKPCAFSIVKAREEARAAISKAEGGK